MVSLEGRQSLLGQNQPPKNIAEAAGRPPKGGRNTSLQVGDPVARDTKYQSEGREAIDGFLSKGQLRALHLFDKCLPSPSVSFIP